MNEDFTGARADPRSASGRGQHGSRGGRAQDTCVDDHTSALKTRAREQRAAGFTLIELLAVMLILSILAAVLVIGLADALKAVKGEITKQLLTELGHAVENYNNEFGAYPPSSFESSQEVANDQTNVGIEALVVALWSKHYEAGGLLKDIRDKLVNLDNDSSPRRLTDFEGRELLEIPDEWGNPIAYVERRDYDVANRRYLTVDSEKGQEVETVPIAFRNSKTRQYYCAQSFQLISAGSDGRFGTEDDITTFDRD